MSHTRKPLIYIAGFWDKVDVRGPNECWPWKLSCDRKGYGQIRIAGKLHRAHRVAFELHHGTIDPDLFVLHACDNPPCCNAAAHHFQGTNLDNVRDMDAKGRRITVAHRGDQHANAKLSNADVLIIRARIAAGDRGVDIARSMNISQSTISAIKVGRIRSAT